MPYDKANHFFGIAAPRCGTTWLARCLSQHPDICFSQPKETDFFRKDDLYHKGVDFYNSHFSHYADEGAIGEFSPFYFLSRSAIERMYKNFPSGKILVLVRDPVERAFSNYIYRKRRGFEKEGVFSNAVRKNDFYLERGMYGKYLEFVYTIFPREQIHVMRYRDIKKDPLGLLEALYTFLGVDASYVPEDLLGKKVNASSQVRYHWLFINKIINKRKDLKKKAIGRAILRGLRVLGFHHVAKFVLRKNRAKISKKISEDVLPLSVRKKYLEYFVKDIELLEKLTGRNFEEWKGV